MIKNYFLIFSFAVLTSLTSLAQQTPIDFSDSSHMFSSWGGSTFAIVAGPVDSNNDTGEFYRNGSPQEQGNYIDLSRPIDLDVEDEITLRFYSFDPNAHDIAVKLENGTNPDVEVVVTAPSNQNAWSDLTFDFSTVGGSGAFSRLVIRIDDGSNVPGAFRIDDINDGNVPTDPHALDVIYTDLVWSDEFDSTTPEAIDSSKWYQQTMGPNGGQWYNNEIQHYTDRIDNSYVENGFLNIVAKREMFSQDGVTLDFTSARLNYKFAFTYGRVDVRAKLPEGAGTWPAIWTLGKNINEPGAYWQTQGFGTTNWPACGEIDIMEHGLGDVNHTSSAIHTPSSSGNTVNTDSQVISDVANNFHVYSVNWSPDQITFLVDDVGFYTYNPAVKDASTWPFDLDQYLILNIAMGGYANGGNVDPNFTESAMVVDYVRVYQNILSTENFSSNDFVVYPNPANSEIKIKSNKVIDFIEIYNVLGKRLLKTSKTNLSINIKDLRGGIYFLNVYSNGSKVVKKVIVN